MIKVGVERVNRTIRRLGWLNGSLYALDRFLAFLSRGRIRLRKYYFLAQPITEKRWLPPRRGAGLEVRRLTDSDPAIRNFPRPAATIPYRFDQGAVCLAEFKGDMFIGFLWLTLGPYREDEVRCRYVPLPPENTAWDFDVYLQPEHRSGVAFLKLWDEANSFLAARGIRWSLSRVSAFNANSMLSHMRMGADRIGSATFLSFGSCQFSVATVSPHFHFSMHADSYPVFALRPKEPGID